MNARPQLTDRERDQIRKSLYEEKLKDYRFILEALGDAPQILIELIKTGLASNDSFILLRAMQESVKLYIEGELVEDAERDLLASIERSGGRKLA